MNVTQKRKKRQNSKLNRKKKSSVHTKVVGRLKAYETNCDH